jgi:2-oxo-3-hexenedioate decarboxylase
MSLAPPQTVEPVASAAAKILAASDRQRPIAPFTERDEAFSLGDAYRVTAEIRRLRESRGERAVGRKIGFTNTTIWDAYNVAAPIWGYVYDTTLHRLAVLPGSASLAPFVEPRIEPEIVFGLARAPEPGMDERALLACLAWVAPGFEVVQSLFPGWRFRAPDTVAAFGLHGALFLGEPAAVTPDNEAAWLEALGRFEIQLRREGAVVETGRAANVLRGGPLAALRHLVEVLADDPGSPALAAGEVVTTGTLTDAYPIRAGETWDIRIAGLPLADICLAF